jgi:Mn2+/Fe2+ NRAMP family transporter
MPVRVRLGLIVVWVISLVTVAILAHAQGAEILKVVPVPQTDIFGSDIGFRVNGMRGNTPVGSVMVRINGQWVQAELRMSQGVHSATQ